jgi:hypothetical protein
MVAPSALLRLLIVANVPFCRSFSNGYACRKVEQFSVTGLTRHNEQDLCKAIMDLLRRGKSKARFVTELSAALGRSGIALEEIERALADLEAEGAVMVREHFCADPHLADVDLRVVALVEKAQGENAELGALRAIDETWNQWLNEYLANHRCG